MASSISFGQMTGDVKFLTPNSLSSIMEEFNSGLKNLENLSNDDIKQINNDFKDAYEKTINSYSFKPNSKDDFQNIIEALYKRTVCGTELYCPDYPGLDKFNMELMPINIDSEFNKFLESKGCADEYELQALNKTPYKTKQDLSFAAESRLRGSLSNLDKSVAQYAMAGAKALIKNVDIETMAKYVAADKLDALKFEKGFLENYSGNEIKQSDLIAWQKAFNAYANTVENRYKEAMKNANPADQLKSVDYSKYDEKYGEKYEKTLALNYEE